MGLVIILGAALLFGLAQFINGMASRRVPGLEVACWTQLGMTGVACVMVLQGTITHPWQLETTLWGVAAGLAGACGAWLLYSALGRASFSRAVGTSTVTTTVMPAMAAIALWGEPVTLLRVCLLGCAVTTVWLLTSGMPRPRSGPARMGAPEVHSAPVDGHLTVKTTPPPGNQGTGPTRRPGPLTLAFLAGLGFAVELMAAARLPPENFAQGLWTWSLTGWMLLTVLVLRRRGDGVIAGVLPRGGPGLAAVAAGALTGSAMWLFHLGTGLIGLTTASAVVAVYPAVPIVLAVLLLGERPGRRAVWGLGGVAGVVVLAGLSDLLG